MQKKVICFMMSIILTMGLFVGFDTNDVYAISQNDVVSQLNSLASQYNGKTATSSQMYMGSQCKGFANWVFLNVFGVYIGPYPESANYKITNPNAQTLGIIEPGNLNVDTAKALLQKGAPGDYIQVQRSTARGRGPHSMILMGVNDNGIEVLDCNSDGQNTIKKQSISWVSFDTANRAMSLYRAYGYSPASSVPVNPQISKNQHWYDIKDRIELTAYADGATSYFMSIFKDGNKIISQSVDGGKYSFDASSYGYGNYNAYFSCSNSAGTVDTQWVNFSVVGAASYSNVYTSNPWYDLTDMVSIGVDSVCAKGQVIGIDKEGEGRVITESTESLYEVAASSLGIGKYSAYFSVYNGSGGVDTERVAFEIIDKPKAGAVVSATKEKYSLSDKVEISVDVDGAKGQVIGIDREGSGRVITEEVQGTKYSIDAAQLGVGNYNAYFSVYNSSGGYDTKSVTFQVVCTHNYMSKIEKQPQCTSDGIIIYICKNCSDRYTEIISATGHQHTQLCNIKTSTCASEGYTGDTYCLDCEQKISSGNKIVKTDHTWNEGEITRQATASADGILTYTCNACGRTKTEKIPSGNQSQDTEDDKKQDSSQDNTDAEDDENTGSEDDENVKDTDPVYDLEIGDVIEDDFSAAEYEVVSVSGSAVCVEYAESMNEKVKIIKIPDTIQAENGVVCRVTAISKGAFKNNRKIKKVLIGNNVKEIGSRAFYGCKNLTMVKIGENVTTIGAGAFSRCGRLTKLTIPSKVEKIGSRAFFGCKKLKKISFKTQVLSANGLNKKAFQGIPEKAVIQVPKHMRTSYERLFCQKGLSSRNKI